MGATGVGPQSLHSLKPTRIHEEGQKCDLARRAGSLLDSALTF